MRGLFWSGGRNASSVLRPIAESAAGLFGDRLLQGWRQSLRAFRSIVIAAVTTIAVATIAVATVAIAAAIVVAAAVITAAV